MSEDTHTSTRASFFRSVGVLSSASSRTHICDCKMVRGHAKQAAQEAAKKKADAQKGGKSQLGEARAKGLKFTCPTCKAQSPNYKVLKEHFDNKHPKDTCPPESTFTA